MVFNAAPQSSRAPAGHESSSRASPCRCCWVAPAVARERTLAPREIFLEKRLGPQPPTAKRARLEAPPWHPTAAGQISTLPTSIRSGTWGEEPSLGMQYLLPTRWQGTQVIRGAYVAPTRERGADYAFTGQLSKAAPLTEVLCTCCSLAVWGITRSCWLGSGRCSGSLPSKGPCQLMELTAVQHAVTATDGAHRRSICALACSGPGWPCGS